MGWLQGLLERPKPADAVVHNTMNPCFGLTVLLLKPLTSNRVFASGTGAGLHVGDLVDCIDGQRQRIRIHIDRLNRVAGADGTQAWRLYGHTVPVAGQSKRRLAFRVCGFTVP